MRWAAWRKDRSWRKAQIEAWRSGDIGIDATGTGILRHRERTVVLHALFRACFQNDAVVINSIASAKDGLAMSVRVPGKANARAEIFRVGMLLQVDDVRHPDTRLGRNAGQIRAGIVVAAGASQIGVVLPAQAEIESQLGTHTPIVLRKECRVVIADLRNRNGHNRRGAVNADGNRDIEVVDDPSPFKSANPKSETRMTVPFPKRLIMPCAV